MGFGRGHEAGQTGALVGSLGVGALPVLAQGHLVADVLALVYVCRKGGHDGLVSWRRFHSRSSCGTSAAQLSVFLFVSTPTLGGSKIIFNLGSATISHQSPFKDCSFQSYICS